MKIFNVTKKNISYLLLILLLISFISLIILKSISQTAIVMNTQNYTSILKESHENPYDYLGKRLITNGYVFRANDFKENQFVVARDMLVSETESRIVGFLCESDDIKNYESNEWIQIDGIFTIGDYHGAMPIIHVNKIDGITTPNDVFVMPPHS